MIGEHGKRLLLPLTRDAQGRMAVRAQKFAKGGALSGEVIPMSGRVFGMTGAMQEESNSGGDTIVHVNVTPPAGSNSASAQQWGATAGRQIQNALRRNG